MKHPIIRTLLLILHLIFWWTLEIIAAAFFIVAFCLSFPFKWFLQNFFKENGDDDKSSVYGKSI